MATTALCAEKTVSASLICPVVDRLLKHHLKVKEDDLGAVIAFKEVVNQELLCHIILATTLAGNGPMLRVKIQTFRPNPGPSSVNNDLKYKAG